MKEANLLDSKHEEPKKPSGPVLCLGIRFENDEARRAYFTEQLRQKLLDPEFRKIEGFPLGTDEAILALSDPPYYCACPNPWIADFIADWEGQKPGKPEGWSYAREPFAADVSEGKNDPIYNAHSYHTKVPPRAIMRYILHYTEPGDIVFDGFCGTGMTGVAAQMCGDREAVLSLGYQVRPDGSILREETDAAGKPVWKRFSQLGARRAVLNDLSPAATFIAYNYNIPVDAQEFEREAKRVLNEVEKECGWMYQTAHYEIKTVNGVTKTVKKIGTINYTIWSDVFVCPECSEQVVFWDTAVNSAAGKVRDAFPCPHCGATLTKRGMERAWETKYDPALQETLRQAKQVPVRINYSVRNERTGKSKRFEKKPDADDIALIQKIETLDIPYWFPTDELPDGFNTRQPKGSHGLTHVHHFYTKRVKYIISILWYQLSKIPWGHFLITSFIVKTGSKLHNIGFKNGKINLAGAMPNVYYVPSSIAERNIFTLLDGKMIDFTKVSIKPQNPVIISSQSTDCIAQNNQCVFDYVFIDPPFGSNINYSELNFIWESWIKVITNNTKEAIENNIQKKEVLQYRSIMTDCFCNIYRLLKPGRWVTVEFSNTKAYIWNCIQAALMAAGFIISNVSALDKGQGTFKSQTTPTAVKQDLVISAYKPNGGFEERFLKEAQNEEGVWDFIRTHMRYLPITRQQGASLQFVLERDPRILFDQMVAYYVRKGYPVPLSSQEFQIGLAQSFIERDGMFFLPDQVAEYDSKKLTSGELQQASLFVSDEASAIQWLRQLLKEKPQTFADINPQFMQQLGGWSKNEAELDLRELLNQNFLCYDGKDKVPEQIHTYLSSNWKELRNLTKDDPNLVAKARDRWYVPNPRKAGDLEKLREKALLKEFEEYKEGKKRLKVFRLEAVRAGFKKAWQERDYAVIISVAEKIPANIMEEDPKLLMWYDQAITRMGGQ